MKEKLELHEVLSILHRSSGLKQREAAEEVGISRSHVSEIARGKKRPSIEVLERFAELYNLKPWQLLLLTESRSEIEEVDVVLAMFIETATKLNQSIGE